MNGTYYLASGDTMEIRDQNQVVVVKIKVTGYRVPLVNQMIAVRVNEDKLPVDLVFRIPEPLVAERDLLEALRDLWRELLKVFRIEALVSLLARLLDKLR